MALPIFASGITSGSATFSTYFQWNRRAQRSAVETFEADHGAWMSARVDGKPPQGSRKLAAIRTLADNRVVQSCEVCNAKVHELRRGRCWGCYSQWVETRPVGVGARCITCNEKRRRVMKAVELFGSWKPMCFNCAGQLLHLDPMPATIGDMRKIVSRERRGKDRRVGKPDTRVFQYERRVGDRRMPRGTQPGIPVAEVSLDEVSYDDIIIEISIDDIEVLGDAEPGMEFDDITQIRDLVRELRPAGFVSASAAIAAIAS